MGTVNLPRLELDLPKRSIFTVPDVAGIAIECESGSVWVTLDNDQRDVVLNAGERFTSDLHRRALVSALEPSHIALAVPRPALAQFAPGPAPSRWRLGLHGLSPA